MLVGLSWFSVTFHPPRNALHPSAISNLTPPLVLAPGLSQVPSRYQPCALAVPSPSVAVVLMVAPPKGSG